jgi:hypothetical protein
MKSNWVEITRVECLIIGLLLVVVSIFSETLSGNNGNTTVITRISILLLGSGFLIAGLFISFLLFKSFNTNKIASFSRYLHQSLAWCLVSLLIIEISLRITVRNPTIWNVNTNWFGQVPAAGSFLLQGAEGFAATQYDAWGEIHTPFQGGENILFLGDSRTSALQVPDDQKYASVAEKKLHADGFNNFDVRNFGRGGLAMADYVSWIPLYRSLLNPKVIVLQLSEYDFVESLTHEPPNYFKIKDDKIVNLVHSLDVSHELSGTPNSYPDIHLMLKSMADIRLRLINDPAQVDRSDKPMNLPLAKQQMERLLQVCEGVKLVVIVFPLVPEIDAQNSGAGGGAIHMDDPGFNKFKQFISGYPEVTVADPLPEFQELVKQGRFPWGFFNSLRPDRGHLNQFGNQILGELSAEAIEKVTR